jgi:ribosomal protein S18 acetylase RimI-like enzyme
LIAEGYRLVDGPPSAEAYMMLREGAGLSPKTREQAAAGIDGAWFAVHLVGPDETPVGMGRVIGDGGWYFHIIDMAVLPDHQRRGLGDAILTTLIAHIRATAPPGAWINLLADPPGRRLYTRHGFTETARLDRNVAQPLTPRAILRPGSSWLTVADPASRGGST